DRAGPRHLSGLTETLSRHNLQLWWTGRDLNPRPSGVLTLQACKPDVLRPDMSVYQAELPAHVSAASMVVGLNLVGGAAAGTLTPCRWFEPGLQAPMAKAFLSTFQACTLPSYVTAATKNRPFVEEYVSFQEGGSMKQACSGGATGRDLSRSHLLHQSIHFFSTEYVLFQRTC